MAKRTSWQEALIWSFSLTYLLAEEWDFFLRSFASCPVHLKNIQHLPARRKQREALGAPALATSPASGICRDTVPHSRIWYFPHHFSVAAALHIQVPKSQRWQDPFQTLVSVRSPSVISDGQEVNESGQRWVHSTHGRKESVETFLVLETVVCVALLFVRRIPALALTYNSAFRRQRRTTSSLCLQLEEVWMQRHSLIHFKPCSLQGCWTRWS